MPMLLPQLQLDKCPHCNVDKPSLHQLASFTTSDNAGSILRYWKVYQCIRCGGAVTASLLNETGEVLQMFPAAEIVSNELPKPARSQKII